MAMQMTRILCGRCLTAAEVPENPRDTDVLRCPACEQVDTVGNAVSDARHHATHIAERAFEQRMLRRGRALSRRTPSVAPVRSLRWISNYAG